MLKEIGLSDSRKLSLPKDQLVYVARNRGNNELAPSENSLKEFKKKSSEYGETSEAHNKVFKETNYEQRFRKEILSNPDALKKLEKFSNESKEKDIYFVCYEGPTKACHRRILLRICEEKFGAKVQIEGVEP